MVFPCRNSPLPYVVSSGLLCHIVLKLVEEHICTFCVCFCLCVEEVVEPTLYCAGVMSCLLFTPKCVVITGESPPDFPVTTWWVAVWQEERWPEDFKIEQSLLCPWSFTHCSDWGKFVWILNLILMCDAGCCSDLRGHLPLKLRLS